MNLTGRGGAQKILSSHLDLLYALCDVQRVARLLNLIDRTKYCLCPDSRDRIFALLLMLNETERYFNIEPDSTKNAFGVYRDTIYRAI
jgi:hypothetical protein